MESQTQEKLYWSWNLQYLFILLYIWFLSSYGLGILLAKSLNYIKIGGFKLGFWFAQQGSIYIFVALIFVYVLLMNRLDKRYHEKALKIPKWYLDFKLIWVALIALALAVRFAWDWVALALLTNNFWPLLLFILACHMVVLLALLRKRKLE